MSSHYTNASGYRSHDSGIQNGIAPSMWAAFILQMINQDLMCILADQPLVAAHISLGIKDDCTFVTSLVVLTYVRVILLRNNYNYGLSNAKRY